MAQSTYTNHRTIETIFIDTVEYSSNLRWNTKLDFIMPWMLCEWDDVIWYWHRFTCKLLVIVQLKSLHSISLVELYLNERKYGKCISMAVNHFLSKTICTMVMHEYHRDWFIESDVSFLNWVWYRFWNDKLRSHMNAYIHTDSLIAVESMLSVWRSCAICSVHFSFHIGLSLFVLCVRINA